MRTALPPAAREGYELTREGRVDAAWIDGNGHMNVMWYTALFDAGCDALLRRVGITPDTHCRR